MEWILGFSVLFNIVLLLALLVTVISLFNQKAENALYLGQWDKWEGIFHKCQGLMLDRYGLFISATGGRHGEMEIVDRNEDKP